MRIVCIGGGPAGLYFGILMKMLDPSHRISVVERNRPCDLAEPGLSGAAGRVESLPEAECALERRTGQLVGHGRVAREPGEIAVDVVEVGLGSLRKGHFMGHTPPGGCWSHNR